MSEPEIVRLRQALCQIVAMTSRAETTVSDVRAVAVSAFVDTIIDKIPTDLEYFTLGGPCFAPGCHQWDGTDQCTCARGE